MKKFLRRFKKSTLIVTLVLALTLIGAGSVYAYYTVHTATMQGNVVEAFTVAGSTGDGSWTPTSATTGIWALDGVPGNTEHLYLAISNQGSVPLTAHVTVTGNCSDVTGAGDYIIPASGGGANTVTITWTVNNSSTPGLCVNTINISR